MKRSSILRFHGAVKRDPAVQAWLDGRPQSLRAIAREWFERMRACGADVVELMHDKCPTVCVGDAGFAYVNTFTAHVNVGFLRGSELPRPGGPSRRRGQAGAARQAAAVGVHRLRGARRPHRRGLP
jgi:hypothetical protein